MSQSQNTSSTDKSVIDTVTETGSDIAMGVIDGLVDIFTPSVPDRSDDRK